MEIKLNGLPVNIVGEVKTLGDLVTHVKSEYVDKRSLLTELRIDGRDVDISLKELEVDNSSSVEVVSESPHTLASKSINNLVEHLSHAVPMLGKAADKFRTEGEEEANKYYSECLGALQLFSEVIDGVGKMLNLDYSKIESGEGSIDEELGETQKLFEAMHEAQKQKDWVLLADIMEYELVPVMENWKRGFSSILNHIEKLETGV